MIAHLAAHPAEWSIAFAAALLATLILVVLVQRHHERRVQWLEHEMAELRAALDLAPTTREVGRRFDMIQGDATGAIQGDATGARDRSSDIGKPQT